MSSSGFSEHKVMLCLDKDLYRAFIKLQADKDLGRSYAGLLPYVEGLFKMGYITREVYEVHEKRYSEPLGAKTPPLTLEQQEQAEKLQSKDKQFKMILDQWNEHSNPEWRLKVFAEAEKFKDTLESARLLLAKRDLEKGEQP
ncbi:hypothetical protein MUO79_06990 [Candidatus Bathyarchaeota archaeon]|nr:hypothetical protein [Candidatus Bathyarchaeota archaeon]